MSEMVVHHSSVSEFFHEAISEAMCSQGLAASAHAEFYLVNLLAEYSHAPLPDQPMSLQLAEAHAADPPARQRLLRRVGDQTLYVSGFFADSLERRMIDADYYITLGGSAYSSLARSQVSEPWGQTFGELADKFRQFVEVLAEVASRTPLHSNADLLQLYERYVRTGSSYTARRLRRFGLGVLPGAGSNKEGTS